MSVLKWVLKWLDTLFAWVGLKLEQLQAFLGLGMLGTIVFLACALALASTPLAFAIAGRQKWFQARRGRQVQRPSFAATVVQQPFEWGYQGMKLMAAWLEGDKSGVPADELIIVPTAVINQGNVDAFSADLKAKISGS